MSCKRLQVFLVRSLRTPRKDSTISYVSGCRKRLTRHSPVGYKPLNEFCILYPRTASSSDQFCNGVPVEGLKIRSCLCARGKKMTLDRFSFFSNRPGRGFGLLSLVALALACCSPSWAQNGSLGSVSVVVLDSTNAVVSGAQLELRDLSTNDVRAGSTQ